MSNDERAARGAALLDRERPGWVREITRPILIQSGWECVLGQVFGGYTNGLDALHGSVGHLPRQWSERLRFATRNGFNAPARTSRARQLEAFAALNEAWHREITARR